jgi:hypothetical protein
VLPVIVALVREKTSDVTVAADEVTVAEEEEEGDDDEPPQEGDEITKLENVASLLGLI